MITVAMSGINAIDNPGPGTGIARSLKESDLEIRTIGLAYDSMEPGIFMDWVIDKSYILPWPSCDPKVYLERLSYIHDREQIDVIIPALDAELPLYMKLRPEIEAMGIKLLLPDIKTYMRRDKQNLVQLAPELGLLVPETLVMSSPADIVTAESMFGYPMMIKGPFYEAFKVRTRAEAEKEFYNMAAKWGYPIIAQQFIVGDEYDMIGLADGHGMDMGTMAIKKIMTTKLGKVWTNVAVRNDAIFEAARKFVTGLKWAGGYELELLQKAGTDEFYLIEINPRFPAWLYMAAGCGINLPERMVKHLLNMPYETHSDYEAGKMLIRYTGEMIRHISDFEQLTTLGESREKTDKTKNRQND